MNFTSIIFFGVFLLTLSTFCKKKFVLPQLGSKSRGTREDEEKYLEIQQMLRIRMMVMKATG